MVTTNSVVNRLLISPERTDASLAGQSEKLSAKNSSTPVAQPAGSDAVVTNSKQLSSKLSVNSQTNSLAKEIRSTDTAMEEIGHSLGKMKKALEGIVKNYPPYPQGSIERAEKLKSFNGLRSLIDRLTFPPDPKISGAMKFSDSQDGALPAIAIENQQVDTGPNGLNIPELPKDASDVAIYSAIENLDTASANIEQKRYDLGEKSADLADKFFPGQQITAEQKITADKDELYEEIAAERKSFEVKKLFSNDTAATTGNSHTQLAELMK